MWYINRIVLIMMMFAITIGCGEEEISNAEKVVGYWQVRAETMVLLNGVPHTEYVEKYWVSYYEDNSGQLYDIDENPTTEINWAYQESDDYDRILISYKLGGGSGLDLFTNELNSVSKFTDNTFRLFKQGRSEVGDSIYDTNTFAFHVRQ